MLLGVMSWTALDCWNCIGGTHPLFCWYSRATGIKMTAYDDEHIEHHTIQLYILCSAAQHSM